MPNKKIREEVKQLSHNLLRNECPYAENANERKKKVRMVRVVVHYTNSDGKWETASKECCAEHQDRAITSICEAYDISP